MCSFTQESKVFHRSRVILAWKISGGKSQTVAGPGRCFAGYQRVALRAIDHSSPIHC
jgi:hypothetical protein